MSAAKLRAILAQIEQAHVDLAGALEAIGDPFHLPEKSKARRLGYLLESALADAEQAENVCRDLLRVEERAVVDGRVASVGSVG